MNLAFENVKGKTFWECDRFMGLSVQEYLKASQNCVKIAATVIDKCFIGDRVISN